MWSYEKSECACRTLHQVLLRNDRAQSIIVAHELADELVQAALENSVHVAVLKPGADGAGLALRRPLPAVDLRDLIEVADHILVAARKRSRHLIVENEQVCDQPGFQAFAVDPMIGRERRDRAQYRRPLEIVQRT